MIADNFDGAYVAGKKASFSFDPNHDREYVNITEVKDALLNSNDFKRRRSSAADQPPFSSSQL